MPPQFANAKAGEVGDVAGLVGERVNGWIQSYPSEATTSALRDGVTIKGRPVDWAWAIPGASEYLVVEFSDSHKQYVSRTELPEHATPALASAAALAVTSAVVPAAARVVALFVAPKVVPDARTTLASPVPVIPTPAARTAGPERVQRGEPSSAEVAEQPVSDLAILADTARKRVFAWIRSHPLNADNCTLADGSHVPGRPVGWAWAVPGTVEFMVVEFSDGHKQYLSPADLPDCAG